VDSFAKADSFNLTTTEDFKKVTQKTWSWVSLTVDNTWTLEATVDKVTVDVDGRNPTGHNIVFMPAAGDVLI
jgi:hypothetical protein